MIYIMSCVWLNYMVQHFQYKNRVGSSPKTKKCVASFLVPGYRVKTAESLLLLAFRCFYKYFGIQLLLQNMVKQ